MIYMNIRQYKLNKRQYFKSVNISLYGRGCLLNSSKNYDKQLTTDAHCVRWSKYRSNCVLSLKNFSRRYFMQAWNIADIAVTHLLWTAAGSKTDKPNICSKCVHKLSDLREKRAVTLVFSDPVRLVQTYRLNDNLSNRYIFNFVNLQRIEALLFLQLRNVNFADRYIDIYIYSSADKRNSSWSSFFIIVYKLMNSNRYKIAFILIQWYNNAILWCNDRWMKFRELENTNTSHD